MPYVVLGVAVLIGVLLLARVFISAEPKSIVRGLKWSGAVLGIALIGGLAATRQLEWLMSAAAVSLPFILRWRRASAMGRGPSGSRGAQTSSVETRFLRMSLDHGTGALDGTVIDGPFAGRRLSELSFAEAMELLRRCRIEDDQSASVLEAYLDRARPGWRDGEEEPGPRARTEGGHGGGSRTWGRGTGGLTREEAYKVLGLEPGASRESIKEAHRRLMRHVHPDMGGTDYLAARINEAKDLLLGD